VNEVCEAFRHIPRKSIGQAEQQLGMPHLTVHKTEPEVYYANVLLTQSTHSIRKSHKLHDNCFYTLQAKDNLILFKKPRSINKLKSHKTVSDTAYLHNVFCLLIDMTDVRKWLCVLPAYQLVNMLEDTWWIHWYEA
jgi:hypothetical protein